jgi:hypothetical protein
MNTPHTLDDARAYRFPTVRTNRITAQWAGADWVQGFVLNGETVEFHQNESYLPWTEQRYIIVRNITRQLDMPLHIGCNEYHLLINITESAPQ